MENINKAQYLSDTSSQSKLDTIPSPIKQYFWKDVEPPNMIKDYDVLGFDADHCLVKYNVRELQELLIMAECEGLVELGYPQELLKIDIEDELKRTQNASVFDMDKGLILKMGEDREVLRAMKGHKVLTQKEIQAVYGKPPTFKSYTWPNIANITDKPGGYWCFITFFEMSKVAVLLKVLQLREEGKLKSKTNFQIIQDLRWVLHSNYVHWNDDEMHSIDSYGKFFPKVVANPDKYIQRQPDLYKTLSQLKAQGKRLFLGTNSHTEYTKFIMKQTLGDDWKSLFDIVCSYCRKPFFFQDSKEKPPFYTLDTTNTKNFRGKQVVHADDIMPGEIHIEGNAKLLEQFFEKQMGRQNLKYAFFGDQYISDVHASSSNKNWDGFAVVEELLFYNMDLAEGIDPRLLSYEEYWGPHYFYDEDEKSGKVKRNYFIAFCSDPQYRKQFKDLYEVSQDQQEQFSLIKCDKCSNGLITKNNDDTRDCKKHEYEQQDFDFNGLYNIEFLTEEQEMNLIQNIRKEVFVESQSGRKKVDYGPKANFKKKKLKIGNFKGFPKYIETINNKFQQLHWLKDFNAIELNILQYDEKRGSNIAPHFDDFWLWGERIVGISLLSDTVMTFEKINHNGQIISIDIPLQRRHLYTISSSCRTQWKHGIQSSNIKSERFVCTFRELSSEFNHESNEIGQKLKQISKVYI